MHIPDDDTQNFTCCRINLWLKCLDTQLTKSKFYKSQKTLGTIVINNSITPLSGLTVENINYLINVSSLEGKSLFPHLDISNS